MKFEQLHVAAVDPVLLIQEGLGIGVFVDFHGLTSLSLPLIVQVLDISEAF